MEVTSRLKPKTYLDLSTMHLTQATAACLAHTGQAGDCSTGECSDARIAALGWPAMTVSAYDAGSFVSVPGGETAWDAMPEDLQGVLRFAQQMDVLMVRFDPDGETAVELPVYEW